MARPYETNCRQCGAPRDPAIKKRALCRPCNLARERAAYELRRRKTRALERLGLAVNHDA